MRSALGRGPLDGHQARYTIRNKDRDWAVIDPQGQLVVEVVRRLAA